MATSETVTEGLHGMFRDVLRDAGGRVTWDSGWQKNVIVTDCRRLLAGFMRGAPASAGIQGLQVGRGDPNWDVTGPPAPVDTQAALVDAAPFTVPRAQLQVDFLAGAAVSGAPTNRLQIVATLGPGVPPWLPAPTLREFGLVAQLAGGNVLINYRTHPAIAKDPVSTLERTIWLVF